MKLKSANSRKARYGGVTAVLTALIIVVVLIVNVIFSALAQKFLWYTDLTPELLFTLSDDFIDLMKNGDPQFQQSGSPLKRLDEDRAAKRAENPEFKDEDLMINIIFCDEPDAWESNVNQRYVYEMAKQLEAEFPNYIDVKNVDIVWNPSAVSKYGSSIDPTNVIVEYGSEYRVRALRYFYTFSDSSSDEPWAYDGEKKLAASILNVTKAETPVACVTSNHGEQWAQSTEFLMSLETAGYSVQTLDLLHEEIPANCRLIVVFDPQNDFAVADGVSEIDEIDKLDAYLDQANSLMVFMSPDQAEPLINFEAYLAEWGISFDRQKAGNTYQPYRVQDTTQSLTFDGFTIKAEYYEMGLGGQVTEELRSRYSTPPTVVFKDAMPISYSAQFSPTRYTDEEDSSITYDYGFGYNDGVERSIYDIFTTGDKAIALAGGNVVERATALNPLKLMTISRESHAFQESNYSTINSASYVLACGSPEFASNDVMINNAYGNAEILEYAMRTMGQEPTPIGLEPKRFADDTLDTITTAEATQYTVVLSVVPAVIALGAGIFVIVRRKYK